MNEELVKNKCKNAVQKALKGDITGKDVQSILSYQYFNSNPDSTLEENSEFIPLLTGISAALN